MTELQTLSDSRPPNDTVHQSRRENSPDDVVRGKDSAHININKFIESSRLLPWLMLMAMFSGASLTAAVVAGMIALQNIKEAKQVQVQLMYSNAIMLRGGLVHPGDMVYGPEGNLEYDGHQFKPREK